MARPHMALQLAGVLGVREAVFFNVPAEPHLSKCLLFFLTAKITRSARLEKNVVYVAKIGGEISDFVCPVYFYHHSRPPNRQGHWRRGVSLVPSRDAPSVTNRRSHHGWYSINGASPPVE